MASTAGSKIEDEKQEYQYSMPFISPAGHEISFYDTPDNQRLVVRHTTGSHIEFKTDGSVFIKAVKDLHMHGSVLSSDSESAGGTAKGADSTTTRFDTDLNLEVGGTLHIKAKKLEVDIGETSRWISGTDTIITANNIIEKADENISMEGTKSVYVDTKEYRERSASHRVEEGTMEDSGEGGINYMNVKGNFVINNTDPEGSITLCSEGYVNIVAGRERVDITGQYTKQPESMGVGTFTQIVKTGEKGQLDKSQMPGDYVFQSDAGAAYTYSKSTPGSSESQQDGLKQTVQLGNMTQEVSAGERQRKVAMNETVQIGGIQRITAQKIFLN